MTLTSWLLTSHPGPNFKYHFPNDGAYYTSSKVINLYHIFLNQFIVSYRRIWAMTISYLGHRHLPSNVRHCLWSIFFIFILISTLRNQWWENHSWDSIVVDRANLIYFWATVGIALQETSRGNKTPTRLHFFLYLCILPWLEKSPTWNIRDCLAIEWSPRNSLIHFLHSHFSFQIQINIPIQSEKSIFQIPSEFWVNEI